MGSWNRGGATGGVHHPTLVCDTGGGGSGHELSGEEKLRYKSSPEEVMEAICSNIKGALMECRDLTQVERRVMDQLFWATTPVISVVDPTDKFIEETEARLRALISEAIKPVNDYLTNYGPSVAVTADAPSEASAPVPSTAPRLSDTHSYPSRTRRTCLMNPPGA